MKYSTELNLSKNNNTDYISIITIRKRKNCRTRKCLLRVYRRIFRFYYDIVRQFVISLDLEFPPVKTRLIYCWLNLNILKISEIREICLNSIFHYLISSAWSFPRSYRILVQKAEKEIKFLIQLDEKNDKNFRIVEILMKVGRRLKIWGRRGEHLVNQLQNRDAFFTCMICECKTQKSACQDLISLVVILVQLASCQSIQNYEVFFLTCNSI